MSCEEESLSELEPSVQLLPDVLDLYCSYNMRVRLLTGWLMSLLRAHFSSLDRIEEKELIKLIWTKDVATSGILIESIFKFTPEIVGKRPAIIVKRGGLQNQRLAIGDSAGTNSEADGEFTTFWVGSLTCYCIGQSGQIAEILATEVARELTQFATVILATFKLQKFQVTAIEDPQPLREATHNCVVPVVIGIAFSESWKLAAIAPPLRSIDFCCLCDFD